VGTGIEKEGYVEGAVFVLSPAMDWVRVLDQPPPDYNTGSARPRRPRGGQADGPFANMRLRAEYKGYKPWRVSGGPPVLRRVTQGQGLL
jgi:hypothetical protein